MPAETPFQQQLDAAVDLGLLTRVVCHELNNLLATQRGYVRLLGREQALPADRQRWLSELADATQAQQTLLASLQARAWHMEQALPAADPGGAAPPDALAAEHADHQAAAEQMKRSGTHMPLVALTRLLGILARASGNGASPAGAMVWAALAPAERAQLAIDESIGPSCIAITWPDHSGGVVERAWAAMEARILPEPGADPLHWGLALIAALLRQYGGAMHFGATDDEAGHVRHVTVSDEHITVYLSADFDGSAQALTHA